MSRRKLVLTSGAIAVGILAGACGGSTKSATPTAPTSSTSQATATTTAVSPGPNTSEVSPSGDIPDTQAYVPYTDASGSFSLTVPEGWARSEAGVVVSFTDKLNTIRIETVTAPSPPSVDSVTHAELPTIQAAAVKFENPRVASVDRKAGAAVLITYRADAPPNPVTAKVVHDDVERYEFWRNGTEVILTLSGPTGADNVDPWRIVTDSFGWRP